MNFNTIIDATVNLFDFIFMILKPIGNLGNWAWGIAIALGVGYWTSLEFKNEHQEEDYNKNQKYIS